LILRTERLILREWRDADFDAWAAMNADPRVMEHFPKLLDRAASDAIGIRARESMAERGFGILAVEIPGVTAFAGSVGLSVPRFEAHFTPCVEIGWRLAHAYWGNGYATEAARATMEDGFTRLGLDEIVAMTAVGNTRSRHVMEKLGMTRSDADDFDHPLVPHGNPVQRHVLYRLQRERWRPVLTPDMRGA
jgi:RimJ/RimL family protein N-acetyltransferase